MIVRISASGGSKDPPFFLFEVQSSDTCVSITIVLKDASNFTYKNALHELQTVKNAINMKCVHLLINLGLVVLVKIEFQVQISGSISRCVQQDAHFQSI